MEANIKEKLLTFSKGMSNIPSDIICDDDSLADCVGLRLKDGELKPIRRGSLMGTLENKDIIYIHKNGEYTHLVVFDEDAQECDAYAIENGKLQTTKLYIEDFANAPKVSSIGNILVMQDDYDGEMKYFKWGNGQYTELGDLPHLSFEMSPGSSTEIGLYEIEENATSDEIKKITSSLSAGTTDGISSTDYANRTNEVVGLIEGAYKVACKRKMFMFPFFMRIGLRLYDGSVTRLTPPVLILPTIRGGAFVHYTNISVSSGKVKAPYDMPKMCSVNRAVNYVLKISKDRDLANYGDLIRSVVVYMTNPVKTYETSATQGRDGRSFFDDGISQEIQILDDWLSSDGTYNSLLSNSTGMEYNINLYYTKTTKTSSSTQVDEWFMPPYGKSDKEIFDELLKSGTFYKVAEIGISDSVFDSYQSMSRYIESHVLENLTTQEQLEHDDYFGNAKYLSTLMYPYNSRLNLANVRRYPYLSATSGTQKFKIGSTASMRCYVYIQGEDSVMKADCGYVTCPSSNRVPYYFFYPDPKAKAVEFVYGSSHYYKKLSVHPRLNGAYYYIGLPGPTDSVNYYQGVDRYSELAFSDSKPNICSLSSYSSYETLPNEIFTSEVNNPWVFNAEGDNAVGTGKIIGLVANTVAISQGQFGQYPMIVFTTQGIYALYVGSTGLFTSSAPMSREVCNNADSITPTDGAVFFTSDKGLMRMIGNQIVCVSDQMMGKPFISGNGIGLTSGTSESFATYLKKCKIAYDYKEKCLHIINAGYMYRYVLDLATNAITRCDNINSEEYHFVLNDYPDNLVQDEPGNIYSFINKPDINEDTNTYNGILMSRPVKMGSVQVMKSLREVVHLKNLAQGSVVLHVYTSNNLENWVEQTSLKGRAWKYFRFGLELKNMKATDSYTGMMIRYQPREANKLR